MPVFSLISDLKFIFCAKFDNLMHQGMPFASFHRGSAVPNLALFMLKNAFTFRTLA